MKMTTRSRSSQRGIALVITLFFVVLITIIAVGFLETARSDRAAASTHIERLRASTFAREGIERSVATLRRETTDAPRIVTPPETDDAYNKRTRNWISQPGALVVPDPASADKKQLKKVIDLSSGAPTSGLKYSDPVLSPPQSQHPASCRSEPAELPHHRPQRERLRHGSQRNSGDET